jgi:hypothetical protein
LMEMAKWKASLNNQCPLNWFKTKASYCMNLELDPRA